MEIRKTKMEDLNEVMEIYSRARQYMKDNGNPNQWVNGYPPEEVVREDILSGASYLCIEEDKTAAVFYFDPQAEDPDYKEIFDGKWLNDEPYGVIHRIAVALHKKGVASYCLDWSLNQCGNLKIDTHRDNLPMQAMLEKKGFVQCGIIYTRDGSERLAYQKIK
ncbi:hypothetical protein SAMN02745751_02734 [Dethiosulfatibacter aminovorans DSM 17477]|uniref:N-acetyltransferase domain-containing protein n=1 Tax=Dethiosulfatibacter aminovorans DSM 17477 TaxID=1121476 RepID=A0A1M6JWK4_9FIRM|nr:GNAT family N-acetyltransferase [Dethiosulfatibacter aminovorans]SHJ51071.1 hypothetical protein SAMN02745751_02734 [Dethiosulfatibacter aminovorans DSM 17477]